MVCLLTPTSRATSSVFRPASTCFSAATICASVRLLFDICLLLQFAKIIFDSVRFEGGGHGKPLLFSNRVCLLPPVDNLFSVRKPSALARIRASVNPKPAQPAKARDRLRLGGSVTQGRH